MRTVHSVGRVLIVMLLVFGSQLALSAGILRIVSSDAAIDWSVQIEGSPITYFSGIEVQLEPGSHRIVATAPGYQPIDVRVSISDGVVTVVTLSPERSRIVETTEEHTLTSRQKVSRLVVVSTPRARPFRIDDTSSNAPASFLIGVGQHTLRSGELELAFEIPEDMVTYLKIDAEQARIYGFNMTETQEAAIGASSQDELFEAGYRLYGGTRGGFIESLVTAFAAAQAALTPYVPAVSFVPPDVMTAATTGVVLLLIAMVLVWIVYSWGRYRFGSPRAARLLVAHATNTFDELRKAKALGEAAEVKRLQARLARMGHRRTRFESKLRARIAKADGVQADPAAERGERRKAARCVRRWEHALDTLHRFPQAVPARRTGDARTDDGRRAPRAQAAEAGGTSDAGPKTVSDRTRGIRRDDPDDGSH